MFDLIFEERNRTLSNLIQLGDYISRTIRENVTLFSVDDVNKKVTYLTESENIITGNYLFDDCQFKIKGIEVRSTDVFNDTDKLDQKVKGAISNFIHSLHEDEYSKGSSHLDEVFDVWSVRSKLDEHKKRFNSKIQQFNESTNIFSTLQFNNLLDVLPNLVSFLKENKDTILKNKEVCNSYKLSNTVSKAFNLQRIQLDELNEKGELAFSLDDDKPVYDMICRQDLIRRDLLESKANFEHAWATSDQVQDLVGTIHGTDKEIQKALAEAIIDVPYLAFASKQNLTSLITNIAETNEYDISAKDIKKFSSTLFELKKPVKISLISLLNEKYGINVMNLRDAPSFSSLVNTQIVLFEALSKLSPKGSVLRNTLSEFALSLKKKTGVEALDLNDLIKETFQEAGFNPIVSEANLEKYLDFGKLACDLGGVMDILKLIKGGGAEGGMDPAMANAEQLGGAANPQDPSDDGADDVPGMEADQVPTPDESEPLYGDQQDNEMEDQGADMPMDEPGQEVDVPGSELEGDAPGAVSKDATLQRLKELEALLADTDIASLLEPDQELGMEPGMEGGVPEEPGMEPEMGGEEMPPEEDGDFAPEEGEEEMPEEGEEEEPEEGNFPPKKDKKKKPKKEEPK